MFMVFESQNETWQPISRIKDQGFTKGEGELVTENEQKSISWCGGLQRRQLVKANANDKHYVQRSVSSPPFIQQYEYLLGLDLTRMIFIVFLLHRKSPSGALSSECICWNKAVLQTKMTIRIDSTGKSLYTLLYQFWIIYRIAWHLKSIIYAVFHNIKKPSYTTTSCYTWILPTYHKAALLPSRGSTNGTVHMGY